MITLKSKNANYSINVPTDKSELDGETISQLLSNITLPKHYCVIALRYKVSLFELVFSQRSSSQKKPMVSVVPLMGKVNKDDVTFEVNPGDRVLIDGADIERGTHLGVNTAITVSNITNYIVSDEELIKKCLNREKKDSTDDIYCLEFKIVPVNALHGKVFGDIIDPFVVKE